MFGLLRYDGKANGKEPERQKERTLEHAELKTKSQQTPVKFPRVSAGDRLNSQNSVAASLCEALPLWPEYQRAASLTERRLQILFNLSAI
jgi:hypothetical protein